jgi:hypothetical protein
MEVRVFHNNNDGAQDAGYSSGDTLTEVYRFVTDEFDLFDTGQEQAVFEWFCLTSDPETGRGTPARSTTRRAETGRCGRAT